MLKMAVIADDLTGAADTGVQFCPHFTDTILVSHEKLTRLSLAPADGALQAVAVYTDSRRLGADRARRRLHRVAHQLRAFRPDQAYKKVDSCIRGNLGAEVDAVMDALGYELSFIAPAFPRMGRTTLNDVHLVEGIPVAETEFSRDPVTPVAESRLSRVVATQSRYQVGHVGLQEMEDTDEKILGSIGRLAASGVRHLVFDVTSDTHLEKIARIALNHPKRVLLVGSAGLAHGLGSHFPKRPLGTGSETETPAKGHHLLVLGTASERTKEQVMVLVARYPYEVLSLSPGLLSDPARREGLLLKAKGVHRLLAEKDCIIRVHDAMVETEEAGLGPRPWSAEDIVRGLGLVVASVLEGTKPASLLLSGGDTASSVLEYIGVESIRLTGEIVPGVVRGKIIGGLGDGLSVVTKAGAFGKEDNLQAVHEYWMSRM